MGIKPYIKLQVGVITYNHAPFIAQALESVLAQETDFPFEILVFDDCSTDGTADIVRQYSNRHPGFIKPFLRDKNLGYGWENHCQVCGQMSAEYVCFLEGDDYFSHPEKLQKQADFLDTNPHCSICFHYNRTFFDDGSQPDYLYPAPDFVNGRRLFSLTDFQKFNFMQTFSVALYRWRFGPGGLNFAEHYPQDIMPSDWYTHMLQAETGYIGFLDEVMVDYRRHSRGLWLDFGQVDFFLRWGGQYLNLLDEAEKRFHFSLAAHSGYFLRISLRSAIESQRFEVAERIVELMFKRHSDSRQGLFNPSPYLAPEMVFRVLKEMCPDWAGTAYFSEHGPGLLSFFDFLENSFGLSLADFRETLRLECGKPMI